jgi:hypothetical protein
MTPPLESEVPESDATDPSVAVERMAKEVEAALP